MKSQNASTNRTTRALALALLSTLILALFAQTGQSGDGTSTIPIPTPTSGQNEPSNPPPDTLGDSTVPDMQL